MSEIVERHHPEAKIPVPPLSDDKVQVALEQLQISDKVKENQLAQYQRILEALRSENEEMMSRYKKLQPFEDLLENGAKYQEILLKDRIVAGKLEVRCKEVYGTVNEDLITVVVEECLRQGLQTRWHITKRELDRKRG